MPGAATGCPALAAAFISACNRGEPRPNPLKRMAFRATLRDPGGFGHIGWMIRLFRGLRCRGARPAARLLQRFSFLGDRASSAMKVTVERAQLLKSLGHVHRVVERRNTIPILGNVLVRAENAKLSLKATDLDLEVTETLAAETATAGSTTVPAHMFYDIVRKLPDGSQIVLEADGDRAVLAIRAGRSRFTLQTLPESDFPDLAAGDMTHSFNARRQGRQAADRPHPVRDLDRGDPLLSQRHLSARRRHRQGRDPARRRHRRPPPRPARPGAAQGRRRHARRDRAAQDRRRGAAADRGHRSRDLDRTVAGEDPLHHRQRRADLEADRRHLPRLRPRHSAEQRQGTDRRQEGF